MSVRSIAAIGALATASCAGVTPSSDPPPAKAAAGEALVERARRAFGAMPVVAPQDPAQVELGRALFFEVRIAADGATGCVTCHPPSGWGADGRARSRGVFGREPPRNTPTVLNAGLATVQHWRADRASLEDEAEQALLGPAAYGLASNADAIARIASLEGYPELFAEAFPGDGAPITVPHFGAAIAAYQRTLISPAPLDAFLAGDSSALDADARAGLEVFLDRGCAACHAGPLVGGVSLEKFGRFGDYRSFTRAPSTDGGRADVTHVDADRDVFKVPQLRNVEHTAPYFHDGAVASLEDAVRVMGTAQLGVSLTPREVAEVVAFLRALSGDVPAHFGPGHGMER